jgi:Na+-transporting methylmalonyl-CoA/oxaloacetate decarboxylase gamma subunit
MRPKIIRQCFGIVALLAAMLLMGRLNVQATPEEDNKEVSRLLEDIKNQAADLKRDSDELESFTRSDVSWESHAVELDQIKDRINTIGKTISRLRALENSASPWQREAIERIIPVAEKLASNTTAAIEHLRKDPQKIHESQYQKYVKSNAEAASQLAALIKDFVEYGKTRTTLEAYERRLEVPR